MEEDVERDEVAPRQGRVSQLATDKAPAAIGPYSQGVSVAAGSRLVFTSGQLPINPETGEMAGGGTAGEARQALQNALAVLASAGASPADVVRATVYVVDMSCYPEFNEVYATFFGAHLPARSVVGVSALPRGASLEVELVGAVEG
jgi:2-iminobutanoate/2-iminopropanoate deaminase